MGVFCGEIRGLRFFLFFVISVLVACASYQRKVYQARLLMGQGKPVLAAKELAPLAEQEGIDQLVYLFDYGTALQLVGNYKESNRIFLQADQLAEVKDYVSVSKQTASLFLNQEMVQYQGDDFEKVMINAMLAINFLSLGDMEGALVETRRLNEKLEHYRIDGKKPYAQNEFALYLSAMIWEANRKWDDAYIDFVKAYKINPKIGYIKKDLVRASFNARRMEAHRKWKKKFNLKYDPIWKQKDYGELVLIYQQGWGPRKYPSRVWRRIPELYPTSSHIKKAKLSVIGGKSEMSQLIYDVEKVAIKTLNDQYAPLIAKRLAGMVVKEVAADQVRQRNEFLGDLVDISLQVVDRADLRQWSTLPATFQVAKIRLKAGKYQIKVHGYYNNGTASDQGMPKREVIIEPHHKTFFTWRTFM